MIVSHLHKFIFIKTSKTAGTSIEIALSSICGDDDIITPITDEDEEIRRQLGYRCPQNYRNQQTKLLTQLKNMARGTSRHLDFYNHAPAKFIKTVLGKKLWEEYYKFTFERNPWDRVVSYYHWKHRHSTNPPPLSSIVNKTELENLRKRGWDLYTINNKIAVDKIFKYENLSSDFNKILNKIGITCSIELPRAKSGYRTPNTEYQSLFSNSEKNYIEQYFKKEINLMDYEF